jgi:hypothetical protein
LTTFSKNVLDLGSGKSGSGSGLLDLESNGTGKERKLRIPDPKRMLRNSLTFETRMFTEVFGLFGIPRNTEFQLYIYTGAPRFFELKTEVKFKNINFAFVYLNAPKKVAESKKKIFFRCLIEKINVTEAKFPRNFAELTELPRQEIPYYSAEFLIIPYRIRNTRK